MSESKIYQIIPGFEWKYEFCPQTIRKNVINQVFRVTPTNTSTAADAEARNDERTRKTHQGYVDLIHAMAQAAGVRVCAVVDTSPRGRRRAAMRAVILQYVGADTATAAGWRRWYTISHQVAGGRRKTVHRVAMLMARGYTRRQAAELLGLSHQMVAQVWPKRSVPLHLQRCARRASRQDVDKDPQAEAWWTEASRWTGVPFQHKTKVISLLRSHGMTLDEVRSEGVVAMLCNRMVVRCLLARGVDGVQPVMGGGVVGGWQGEVDNCGGLGRVYGGEVLRYDGEVARRRCRSPVAS